MYEKHQVDIITYKSNVINDDVLNRFNKSQFFFFKSHHETPKHLTYFNRLISKTLPGFSSHKPHLIAKDIDDLSNNFGKYDIYYFATQLMGQSKLFMKTSGSSIIDLYDVYSTYSKSKLKDMKFYRPFYWLFLIEAIRIKQFEKQILRSFDIILVTCLDNFLKVKSFNLPGTLYEISNGTNYPEKIRINKGNNLLMVGNYEYSGNLEGIDWFLKSVWPKLKVKINLKLVLVGKYSDKLKQIVKDDSRIDLTGLVDKLDSYYENACCVILPLFNDGGTKTKLIEALAFGVPIVSTSIGAKGFEASNTILISDQPEKFCELIEKVVLDDYPIKVLMKSRNLIKNNYTWDRIGDRLNKIISNIDVEA